MGIRRLSPCASSCSRLYVQVSAGSVSAPLSLSFSLSAFLSFSLRQSVLSDFGFVSLFLISSDAPQLLQPKEKAGKPASFSVAADEKKWNVSAHDRESVERYDVGWIEWAEVKGQAEAKQRPKRCPTEAKHRRFQSTSSSKIIPRCCCCRWYCFDVVVIVVILLIFHYLVGSDQALYKLILL